jgi:hypothetical protein
MSVTKLKLWTLDLSCLWTYATIVAHQFNSVEPYARQLHIAHPLLVVTKIIRLQARNNFYDYFTYLQVVTLKLNHPQEL